MIESLNPLSGLLVPALLALGLNGCDRPDEKAHMTVSEQVRAEIGGKLFAEKWTGKRAVIKLSDQLILAVPPEFQRFWTWSEPPSGPDNAYEDENYLRSLPFSKSAGFDMHLPLFDGYTPENYLKSFDKSLVEIVSISPEPSVSFEMDAPGYYPPNMFNRVKGRLNVVNSVEFYGLSCYREKVFPEDRMLCYGMRPGSSDEFVLVDILVPPFKPFNVYPTMQARYATKRYGGVAILWRTHMDNFQNWREIDEKISWYLDKWNVAPIK